MAHALPAAGLEPLRQRFDVWTSENRPTSSELRRQVKGAAAIVADPTVAVDSTLLEAAGSKLRVVANFAAGYDNIEVESCLARGVIVTNTPDVLTNATAELTLGLMLAAARRIGEGERLLRGGRWTGWEPGQLLGRELGDSTIGIVGLGRIGLRVAELLQGFGAKLLYASRAPHAEMAERLALERRNFDELIAEADLVTLHVPLTADTRNLIDRSTLERFRPGSILVNTARGGILDLQALVSALRSGRLAAAALDVYAQEPQIPSELLELENLVLSPHIGSATQRARNGMARLVADNVISVLEGRGPVTPVAP